MWRMFKVKGRHIDSYARLPAHFKVLPNVDVIDVGKVVDLS